MYRKLTQKIINILIEISGEKNVVSDLERMWNYGHDEFSLPDIVREPEVVVKPGTSEEIGQLLKLANREKIPITPRGGGTGLCGGCVPLKGGIVLSLERLNRILEVDKKNQMAVVEAGVTLKDFYARVEEDGLFFPPHPGDESAMIGGAIATNAGGSRAVKYGVIRDYVKGLEVVLPSGKIIDMGGKLMKSSTGYNLMHLIIGSEGTLGIITKATIQLVSSPLLMRSLIVPFDVLEDGIDTVPLLMEKKILPLAVEFIPREVIEITEEYLQKKWPCHSGRGYLLIILDAPNEAEMDRLSEVVAEICMENKALDVFVADSPSKQQIVLEIRSQIYEAIKAHTLEIMDIVVPRAEIAEHVRKVEQISREFDIWLPTFGHAADGNVHTHIMKARFRDGKILSLPETEWREKLEKVREELYRDCKSRGGMISGEHGIGIVKKPYLSYVLDEEAIALMKGIKSHFDPHNILNPGKIFD